MTTPLPEPTYYLASNGRLFQADGDVDCTGKQLTIYTADQMRANGAAEYRRAIADAAQVADSWTKNVVWEAKIVAINIAKEIRKLGAAS